MFYNLSIEPTRIQIIIIPTQTPYNPGMIFTVVQNRQTFTTSSQNAHNFIVGADGEISRFIELQSMNAVFKTVRNAQKFVRLPLVEQVNAAGSGTNSQKVRICRIDGYSP